MKLWIKNIGAGDDPLPPRWFDWERETPAGEPDLEFRRHVRFSDARRPTGMSRGDLMLFHAYVETQEQGRFCAVAKVTIDAAEHDPRFAGDNWPWRLSMTPLLVVPVAPYGPTLGDAGFPSNYMAQRSHVEASATEFARVVRLMVRGQLPSAVLTWFDAGSD